MCTSVVACTMSIDVLHNCPFYPGGMRPCKWLVACHRTPCIFPCRLQGRLPYCSTVYFSFQLSWATVQATGCLLLVPMQMYWSLAWSLVQSQGFPGKSLVLEESIQLHQATWASAWSLAINFNGNQGGCLSSCHHELVACI